jgi:hypothetical protein
MLPIKGQDQRLRSIRTAIRALHGLQVRWRPGGGVRPVNSGWLHDEWQGGDKVWHGPDIQQHSVQRKLVRPKPHRAARVCTSRPALVRPGSAPDLVQFSLKAPCAIFGLRFGTLDQQRLHCFDRSAA